MLNFWQNVLVLLHKELLMIFKDKRGRFTLVMPILMQTLLFGYVATFDLNEVEYALFDLDRSHSSRELVRQFDGSKVFRRVENLNNTSEIASVLDNKRARMVLHIGASFERTLSSGGAADVQILVDGRNSNVAGTAAGYATTVVERYNEARYSERGYASGSVGISSRAWFNPNLETRWNILSGLLAILCVVQVMLLAGQSVAREKEQGTFDQLLVTPFTTIVIMLGKALPPVLVGVGQATIVLLLALHWFGIPFSGSYLLLYAGLFLFNFSIVGIGLCISALTSTMQQSMLFSFSLLVPMILLSGFTTPIASMPDGFQTMTLLNPVRYGVEFAQRIYLEGAGFAELWHVFAPLLAIAAITLGVTAKLFRRHLG